MQIEIAFLMVGLSFGANTGKGAAPLVLGNGSAGYTKLTFADSAKAAEFFTGNKFCALPCWDRLEVVGGKLFQVR